MAVQCQSRRVAAGCLQFSDHDPGSVLTGPTNGAASAQGRELSWLFATREGQSQVAVQCQSRRVILVALNRRHTFTDLQACLIP